MQQYMLTVLVAPAVKGEAREKFGERMEKIVKAAGGKLGKLSDQGQKQLTYKIGGQSEAGYMVWELEMPGVGVVELKKKLDIDKEALRYLLVKTKGVKPGKEEVKK